MSARDEVIRERKTDERLQGMDRHEVVDEIHRLEDRVEELEALEEVVMQLLLVEENREEGEPPDHDEWEDLIESARRALNPEGDTHDD
jgi:hypothetical protein